MLKDVKLNNNADVLIAVSCSIEIERSDCTAGNNREPHELPKTEAGTDRVINLIQPAIDVLQNQAGMTRLGK